MSLARLLGRSEALSDGAKRLFGDSVSAPDSVDLEAIVRQLEQDVSLTLRLIQDNSIEAKAKVSESVALAQRIQTASHHLASLSGDARANAECLVETARHLEQSSRQIKDQADTSDAFLGEARSLTDEVGLQMSNLRDAASTIASVTGIIRSVARQTNLLALNATIEAARAGPASQGFTVVANEVKSLANDVHRATSSIAGRIHDLEKAMSSATTSVGRMIDLFGRIDPLIEAINASAVNQIEATLKVATTAVETANFADAVADGAQSMQALAANVAKTTEHAGHETERMAATIDRLSSRSMFYFRQSLIRDRRETARTPMLHPVTFQRGGQIWQTFVLECSRQFMTLPASDGIMPSGDIGIVTSSLFGELRGRVINRTEMTSTVELLEPSNQQLKAIDQAIRRTILAAEADSKPIIQLARQISQTIKLAIESGEVTLAQLLSDEYNRVPETSPPQYITAATNFYDRVFQPFIDKNRHIVKNIIFILPVDKNSYTPVHFAEYSQPQRPGQTTWNDLNCRNRRIMTRSQTSRAVRNQKDSTIFLYVREMSDGNNTYCRLYSAPIWADKQLWGNLICAINMDPIT